MIKTNSYLKSMRKNIDIIISFNFKNIPKLIKFYNSYNKYKLLNQKKESHFELFPIIDDNKPSTPFDSHYFYQGVWAFNRIKNSKANNHVDIGSDIRWIGLLSEIIKVTFIDIRPFETDIKNLTIKKGDITNLPFTNNSVNSLSCLHVAEHIGLGRYGDKLDPNGTKKACEELSRILKPQGNLYFSVPVGEKKIYFNAHRVHSPNTIIEYFEKLELIELSGITDTTRYIKNISIKELEQQKYACGLFHFQKGA